MGHASESVGVPPAYEYPVAQRNLGTIEGVSTEITTKPTTTTEKSSWLFVPFSNFFGGSHEEESTTVTDANCALLVLIEPVKLMNVSPVHRSIPQIYLAD